MSEHVFGLQDHDFWSDPFKAEPTPSGLPPRPGPPGLVIDAPSYVALGVRETLPVVVRHTMTLKKAAYVSFRFLALVTAVDVDRNELYVGPALDQEGRVREERTAPAAEPPDGMMMSPYLSEVRARAGVPWQPSNLLVTVLLRDEVSNRVTTRLDKQPGSYEDPEVRKFLEAQHAKQPLAPVSPAESWPYPTYKELPNSPDAPDSIGIALAADRVSVLSSDSRAVVRGSFRLAARKEDIVPRLAASSGEASGAASPKDTPTAIVGIHLLATGADSGVPIVLRLRVPSHDPIDPNDPNPVVTGCFAIDLLSYKTAPWKDETYFLYAFSRESMAGPVPCALVHESMLPPGAK
ncbi:MAG: hypothetical protein IPK72_03220 [Candidatus Eisenbacteria bacterium]|nr:hypothetical protein [Candidatus Eisenbacteria bacterium]